MAEPTTYVILHKWSRPASTASSDSVSAAALTKAQQPKESWVEVATRDAARKEDAVKAHVEETIDLPEGDHEFRAVAKSAWGDETLPFTISTRRVVEAKKKEAVGANA